MLYHHGPPERSWGQGHGSYILIDLVAKYKSGELRCPVTALISSNCALRSSDRTSYRIVFIRIVHEEIKLHLDDNK